MKNQSITDLLVSRLKNIPTAFERYSCLNSHPVEPNTIGTKDLVFSAQIACQCGNHLFQLKTAQTKELRGVCVKSTFTQIAPPIYTICSTCNKTQLLYDPVINGWKGELELVPEKDSALVLCKLRENPGCVYVCCSYSQPEKYQALIDNGISDLENYFDAFRLIYTDAQGASLKELFSCAC